MLPAAKASRYVNNITGSPVPNAKTIGKYRPSILEIDPTCDNSNGYTIDTSDDLESVGVCNTASTNHIGQWKKASVESRFSDAGNYYIRLFNNQTNAAGNDFGLDDVSFVFRNTTNGTILDTSSLNNSPTVTAGGTTAFTEQTPVAAAGSITISEPDDDSDWNGGTLKVKISANSTTNDSLTLPTTNPGSSGIWIDGTAVKEDTTQIAIASAASVSNSTEWTFTLNSSATDANVQKLGRAIFFNNSSDTPNTTSRTVQFTATDKKSSAKSDTQTISITVANDAPTLSSFSTYIDTTAMSTEVEITLAELITQGNEADVDGTVDAFIVQEVSTGTLKIGASSGAAMAYDGSTNNSIDSSKNAYWTSASDATSAITNAFTVKAKDNDNNNNLSNTAVPAQVNVGLTVTSTEITSVDEDDGYSYTITDNGGGDVTWAVTSGESLPSWLALQGKAVTGTPKTINDRLVLTNVGDIENYNVDIAENYYSSDTNHDTLSYTGTLPTGIMAAFDNAKGTLNFTGTTTAAN